MLLSCGNFNVVFFLFGFFFQISEVKSDAAVSVTPSRTSSIASSLRRRLSAFSTKVKQLFGLIVHDTSTVSIDFSDLNELDCVVKKLQVLFCVLAKLAVCFCGWQSTLPGDF